MMKLFCRTSTATTVLVTALSFSLYGRIARAQDSGLSERQILLELYEATGGSSWNDQYGWKDNSKNICGWYGVYCETEAAPDQMTDDKLYNTTMDTSTDDAAPTRRRRLEQLEQQQQQQQQQRQVQSTSDSSSYVVTGIDLSSNYLVGQTPTSLWTLPKLNYLALSWNDQLVVDATNLYQATQLRDLHVPGTATSVSFLASQLVPLATSLTSLHASAVSPDLATTTIPSDVWKLTQLRSLHLGNCSLQGTIDSNLGYLSKLQELDLYANQLTGTIPTEGLTYLTDLTLLVLANNALAGTLPNTASAFSWPETLEYVYLEHNRFTGSLPSFGALPDLKLLTLQENQLTGSIPYDFLKALATSTTATLSNSTDIMINVAGNLLTGTVPASLSQLSKVALYLDLADNQFTAVDRALCSMDAWMQGDVATHGCYAYLCPRGTYHPLGRESTLEGKCWSCPSNTRFLGSTTCLDQTQDLALLNAIYAGTGGSSWFQQEGWDTAGTDAVTNFCTWYGVTCWDLGDVRDGRVRAIRLPFNNLVGTLPDEVFQFAHLTLLDVSSNTLLAVPFDQVRVSQHLQVLNIGHTNTVDFTGLEQVNSMFHHLLADHLPIRGPLPSQVFSLIKLKTLSMAGCQLDGSIPKQLEKLTDLEELYLYDNALTGSLPDTTLTEMSSLRIVSLAQNALTGTIPSLLAWVNLQALSLYDQVTKGGGLDGPLPTFETHDDLTNLQLSKNLLNGTIPSELLASAKRNVSILVDLSHNAFAGTVPGSLSRFTQMNIYLEGNLITEVDRSLCLKTEWMSGAVAAYNCSGILCPAHTTGGRQQFDDLTCQQCPSGSSRFMGQTACGNISGSISWTSSDGLTQQSILQRLYTSCGGSNWRYQNNWNDATTSVCDWYGIVCDETDSVTSIALGSNQLAGSVPSEIFLLPQLKRLSLYENAVTFSFDGIENAQNLRELVLDETTLTSLTGVGNAVGLRQLNARFNKLTGTIPEEISQLTNLQVLGLAGNAFTGSIPTWLSQLTLLQDGLLSNNKLTGTLYDFEGLSFLQYLEISDNLLTGPVPQNFLSALPVDQSILVDLSNNDLSGSLSTEVATRAKGRAIDLHDNRIQSIDTSLCSASIYECDGILCPIGTSNPHGRQTNSETPCQPCPEAKFMGSTLCGKQSSANRVGVVWILLGALGVSQIWAALSWML